MRRLCFASLILVSLLSSGCYYSQLASGQLKLLWSRQPIDRVLEAPETPEQTRSLLRLVLAVRAFADELGLRVDDQYTSYVEWPHDRIITTLVRTRPGSVEAVPYRFPFVGALPYKGYFDRDQAEAEARRLREEEAFDVCVSGVSAYSTLGWMDDPVTSPMLRRGAASLVETLLHELVHATAFVRDDVDFNESVAQFIGQEAAVRFFRVAPEDRELGAGVAWPEPERVRDSIADRRAIARVTVALRERIVALAGELDPSRNRAELERDARAELAALPLRVLDPEKVAAGARLTNACLALRGTYIRNLPRHAEVLAALGGDLEAMIRRLAEISDSDRGADDFYRVSSRDEPRDRSTADQFDHAFVDETAKDF